MRGTVDRIKERLDIVDVIGSYIPLEKSGAHYKGRCPFHNEKTASFFVSQSRQNFYCFGCGAKGDVFTFVEELDGIDFRGALKFLADKAGVEIQHEQGPSKTEKDMLYHALDDASLFFEAELQKNNDALSYLKNRGVSEESIKNFRIGYAPLEWRALLAHLESLGHRRDILLKAGLVKWSADDASQGKEKTERLPYDVFRGRVMFPLQDSGGKVIAFSGRALQVDAIPKYLNSPDTVLFTKSEVLYGLDKAKEEIRKKDYAVLVEGQLDLVLSHQAGIKNTVASSGTAFTSHHLERLKRLSQRIILAFDGDAAGEKAAQKSAMLGLMLGMEVKIAPLPDGRDPADMVRESSELWKDTLRSSVHAIEHVLARVLKTEDHPRKVGKMIVKEVLPLITLVQSAVERSHFISLIAKQSGIREEVLWEDLRHVAVQAMNTPATQSYPNASVKNDEESKQPLPRKNHIERRLIGILFWQKSLPEPSIDVVALEKTIVEHLGESYYEAMMVSLAIEKELLIYEAENYSGHTDDDDGKEKFEKDITELLLNLEDDLLREELATSIAELARAENVRNENTVEILGKKVQEIHTRMRGLEEKRKLM